MKRIFVFDIETDGFDYTKMHCLSVAELKQKGKKVRISTIRPNETDKLKRLFENEKFRPVLVVLHGQGFWKP